MAEKRLKQVTYRPMRRDPTLAWERDHEGRRWLVLYCDNQLRKQWPNPLAEEWQAVYPFVFSRDDLRYTLSFTRTRPGYHFVEWFAAIQLYHFYGVRIIMKRYSFGPDQWKMKLHRSVLGPEGLNFLRANLRSHPPDIFLFEPETKRFWFAEVKGPRDRLHSAQEQSHALIQRRFHVPVELVSVVYRRLASHPLGLNN